MGKGMRASTLAILSLAVAGMGLGGCAVQEPAPFDPLTMQAQERQSSSEVRPTRMYPLPTGLVDLATQPTSSTDQTPAQSPPEGTPEERAAARRRFALRPSTPATTGPSLSEDVIVRMSLREVIARSVLHGSEVRVAGFDPAIAKTRVLEAEARFDPTFFINAKYEHQDVPYAGQAIQNPLSPTSSEVLNVERGEVYTFEPGVKQLLPSGGEMSFSVQGQYNYLLPRRFTLNPYWDDQLKLQLTQPLMRNAGFEVNEARITIARNDARVSILDFRKTLEENLAELEKDYWQAQEAEAEVRIQEALLVQTRATAHILFEQANQGGAVSRVQTSQAQASIRSREAVLIRARARLRDISDDMKRRMNDPDFPVAGEKVLLPSLDPKDQPVEQRIQFVRDDQIRTAMVNRFELGQQQLRIDDSLVALKVAVNNLNPKLDLTGAITLEGISTFNKNRAAGSESNAWDAITTDGHVGFSIGLALEVPIGNREAAAIYRRAQLQRLQAIEQYRNLIDQVALDVTTAIREVETSWNEIGSRRQERFAQEDNLSALEDRRANGEGLTPTFVQLLLDAQERLADSQREEALAIASYQVAIARLERSKGTLLRYNNVALAEENFMGNNK